MSCLRGHLLSKCHEDLALFDVGTSPLERIHVAALDGISQVREGPPDTTGGRAAAAGAARGSAPVISGLEGRFSGSVSHSQTRTTPPRGPSATLLVHYCPSSREAAKGA